ncbi:hypothetical protein JTE90_014716 [Oedothorax gibbosus]|uniref:Uncharacterized protein n=1 Tax=Oedothorax gibbosus TaxID=931172 RepID=A0AAV6UQW8_9ARAC|nr:hypothetical protein JTE90_014716 [Oedothorax gibbosus]
MHCETQNRAFPFGLAMNKGQQIASGAFIMRWSRGGQKLTIDANFYDLSLRQVCVLQVRHYRVKSSSVQRRDDVGLQGGLLPQGSSGRIWMWVSL